jgi:PAS domain S-box-containing protein
MPVLITDLKGTKVYANTSFNDLFVDNKTTDESFLSEFIIYNSDNEIIDFDQYPFISILKSSNNSETINGKINDKWYLIKSVKEDKKNFFDYIITSFEDISKEKETEDWLKFTTENVEAVLYATGPVSNDSIFVSNAVEKLFGFTPDEIFENKLTVLRRIYPEYLEYFRFFLDELNSGKSSIVEYKFKDKYNCERFVRHSGTPIIRQGKIEKIVGVILDITEEKEILEKLEKSEERFRLLIDTANDFIFTLDNYGYFLTVNKSGAKSLGYIQSEIIGKHFLELIDEGNKPDVAFAFQKILTSGKMTSFEAAFIDKFGKNVLFEIQASPMIMENKIDGILAISRDITARTKDEMKLKELNAKLIEANRINAIERDRAKHQISVLEELNKLKNEFISNVSHELRTPLASIVGFAETIASDTSLTRETINEFNNIIVTEGKRLAKFINDLLDFSKVEEDKDNIHFDNIDIIPIVNNVAENFRKQAEQKKITLTTEIPEAEIIIKGDKERLSSAFGKILDNSIKFTNKNGRVRIIVQDFLNEVEIIINDTGIGIRENDLPKIFDKFRKVNQKDNQLPGAGLGLTIVKQIIDAHKGLVQVKSEFNKGTTFIVKLPKKPKE